MKLKITEDYYSLKKFETEELPNFIVITGKNGSGKSQLIELFKRKKENRSSADGKKLILNPDPDEIQIEGFDKFKLSSGSKSTNDTTLVSYFNEYKSFRNAKLEIVKAIAQMSDENEGEINEKIIHIAIAGLNRETKKRYFAENPGLNFRDKTDGEINTILTSHFNSKAKAIETSLLVSKYKSKKIEELSDVDFLNTSIPVHLIDQTDLFNSELGYIFYSYLKKRDQNFYDFFRKKETGVFTNSISDADFEKQNPPPWKQINDILKRHNINYKFNEIDPLSFARDKESIEPELIKVSINAKIDIGKLSSGEKVIMGLIVKLFTSEYYLKKLTYPDVLVLDEPDAHLHPQMSKLLIDVLLETFVRKLGIKVIMTTHSPTTVALCPDEFIFELKNDSESSLNKITKDEALKILTSEIPTLTIDYNNHRQIFVESPTDTFYYQTVFDALNKRKLYPYRCYFISLIYGKGNCQQVKKIVSEIRDGGNKTVWGIIDWDNENKSENFSIVHGEYNRYNIENYIFDPLYFAILFLLQKNANGICKELNFDEIYNPYSLKDENNERLQEISDWFFERLYSKMKKDHLDLTLIKISYLNGKSIKVPKWYLSQNGHDIENTFIEVFPSLKKYERDIEGLKKQLIEIMAITYDLIPSDSEAFFSKLNL